MRSGNGIRMMESERNHLRLSTRNSPTYMSSFRTHKIHGCSFYERCSSIVYLDKMMQSTVSSLTSLQYHGTGRPGLFLGIASMIINRLPLPMTHPVVYIFVVYTMNSLYTSTEAELDLCARLLLSFPQSLFIMGLRANAFYNLHKYPEAEAQFDVMLGIDQYRTDELEVLVHVLYAVENKERLSVLAQFHLVVNRDRPQVCFLLGCHHSLRSEHEKAVKYFRRATELDRTFSSAWTFMGTEFLDMANYHAAIESFRRAVDANPKDYRAWTGLGKAYVMMGMPLYGLHYQSRALHIRPDEAECWEDQANAQEALGKTDEAISSYRRALEANAPHPTKVFVRLSQLLSQVGDSSGALTYAQEAIRAAELNSQPVEQYAKALVAVAEFQLRQPTGDWKRARDYLERVLAHTSPSGDDSYHGKALELLKMAKTKLQMRGMMI
ncbi:unnamed protein product [Mycena citricolor]|uniref:Uncharacterized protein n=1 Tax=Mycena citricolor TaxID=2018698 RepID=A0AAD2HIS3_9AGAR|nr:unnamed protein product [Mycena citricolor]